MSVRGWVKGCAWEPRGSELVADAAIGDDVLEIEHVGEFDDDIEDTSVGMWLELDGVHLPYVSVDNDADTVTLASPLTFAASVDDKVSVVSGGQVMRDYIARVDLGSGDPVEVIVPFGDRDLWPEGDYVDPVQVLLSNDLEHIVEVPGRTPSRDSAFIRYPFMDAFMAADEPWPSGVWQTLDALTITDLVEIAYLGAGVFELQSDGVYDFRNGVRFAGNGTGVRAVRMLYGTEAGTVASRSNRVPAVAGEQMSPETAQLRRMVRGDTVRFQAYQDSGDDALVMYGAESGAINTTMSILRVSP